MSFASEHKKILYVSICWFIFQLGVVIGTAIPVGQNWNAGIKNNSRVGNGTYVDLFILMLLGSKRATRQEHDRNVRESVSKCQGTILWEALLCLPNTIIGYYQPIVVGSLVGIPQIRNHFGYAQPVGSRTYVLAAFWISAFTYAPVIGFMVSAI
ncbi:hypothetical protein K504DRAFT_507624 [Pleomassaria siparia CBS 279.74]|uniref:Uncharacterized protein n=1 Tax=Pleomassaria siparia CBS 279.74 TaxID=1314801 RepID=A0A6G1JTR7_9PLEO|nr:hypothetical protein K504DRAFT_507624 [Pleomassaria siparia CBS 279.74]